MSFKLPSLPYSFNALEPYIDEETMKIHYDKHHGGYVEKLNLSLDKHTELQSLEIGELLEKINELPDDLKTSVRNNGGGHANHSLFWETMKPEGSEPSSKIKGILTSSFGSFDNFKEKFTEVSLAHFGSGWAWLVMEGGKLMIVDTINQDSPIMSGKKPLLGIDVWEHAYYLKYQNKRAEYIAAWWHVVNWEQVQKNFE